MILLIIILALIILGLGVYVFYLRSEIRNINQQLDYIDTYETNAELTHQSRLQEMVTLVFKVNRLIRRNKSSERQRVQQETETYQTLSSLSHDLRTPLTTAYGYTNILIRSDKENASLTHIRSSLDETLAYLDYISDYTSIAERKLDLHPESLVLADVVGHNVVQYYDRIQEAGIDLQLDLDNPAVIIADPLIFKRITTNLVGNVIKYAHSRCTIAIRQDTDKRVYLEVRNDTRVPIADLERLTQRFVTGDDSRTNKSIGLGLNIIQNCCDIIGATMSLHTEGTTFAVQIHF